MNLNTKLNRFVQQSLDNIEFKCEECKGQYKYEGRKAHWKACGYTIKCAVEGCNIGQLETADQLRNHWLN